MPGVVQFLDDFLTERGYEVQTAATGIEALNRVVPFQPDVILLDMQMPGITGMAVLDAVRRAGLNTPVIAISAVPPAATEGFFALIRKPFELESRRECCRECGEAETPGPHVLCSLSVSKRRRPPGARLRGQPRGHSGRTLLAANRRRAD